MWKLALLLFFVTIPVAKADITHRLSSSTQLTVNAASTNAQRIPSTYSVAGNNITAGTMGGLTKPASATAAATQIQAAYTVTTAGSAFSLSESFTYGDAIVSTVTVPADGLITTLPVFGETTTYGGGVKGTLAGTITSAGVTTLTAGGAGTTAIGQFVSEITVE
jgi:hypothetical protein